MNIHKILSAVFIYGLICILSLIGCNGSDDDETERECCSNDDDDDDDDNGDDDDSIGDDDEDDDEDTGYDACYERCDELMNCSYSQESLNEPSFENCLQGCMDDVPEMHRYRHIITNWPYSGEPDCLGRVCAAVYSDPDHSFFIPSESWNSDDCIDIWDDL